MNKYRLALLASLAAPLAAVAIQPVDAGLLPLYERVAEIQKEQLALIRKLEDPSASSASRVYAHRSYLELGDERSRIDAEIAQARKMAGSGYVKYLGQ